MTCLSKLLTACAALTALAAAPVHAQNSAAADLLQHAIGQAQQSGALGQPGGNSGGALGGALGGLGQLGALGDLGGLALPKLSGSSAGNVAGLLEYCVRHNYLKKASIESLQTKLLAFAGIPVTQPQQDPGYTQGLGGLLSGDGQGFNLSAIKGQATEKACDHILRSATSLF